MRRYYLGILFILVCAFTLFRCKEKEQPKTPFRNIQNEAATYVGMNECRTCHEAVYKTYIETGMGQSWGLANKEKSAADFSDKQAPVYDKVLDLYYKAFWKSNEMFIKEYRLNGKDTTHYREEKIDYIVGSGQHTNSHILNTNGYLHQAPITFYTQKGTWDLAPGFEDGHNERFSRMIQTECITCHNGYPKHIAGSLNKYTEIKLGIDCERCHGPGSIHVAEKKLGKIIDTSKGPDYSIVNPRRLTTQQQNDLCQRCHLQGIAVLNDGKDFFDFLPTDALKNTMNVFMPNFSGSQKHMIMASHVERMKMSNCYINSGKMSCITCHNPHFSVKVTPIASFNTACKNCHTTNNGCTEKLSVRQVNEDNCSGCHMAKNESIDIPHVAVTDHYIRRKPTIENEDAVRNFIALKSYNNDAPTKRSQARAFLEFYERYQPNPLLLDSALAYLAQSDKRLIDDDIIRVYFLKRDYQKVIVLVKDVPANKISHAWTAYRIGESFFKANNLPKAVSYLERSAKLLPFGLDFRLKLANAYIAQRNFAEAKKELFFVIKEYPKYDASFQALGYIYLDEKDFSKSSGYTSKAIALNPNSEQSYINLAVAYYNLKDKINAKKTLQKANRLFPNNQQVQLMLNDL